MAKAPSRRATRPKLSHLDARGKARMVDVGEKPATRREARATGEITMSAAALRLIRTGTVAKGDPLQTARLAGIMAAKQTAALIPLCHPLALTHVSVDLTPTRRGYRIEEVPVTCQYHPSSSVRQFRHAINMIIDLVRIVWQDRRGRYDVVP